MERPLALLLDARAGASASAVEALEAAGIETVAAFSAAEALETLRARPVKIALLSAEAIRAGPERFLEGAAALRPALVVVVFGASGGAVVPELLRAGAFDVEPGFPDPSRLRSLAQRALAQHDRLEDRHGALGQGRAVSAGPPLVGPSYAMQRVRERLAALAPGDVAALAEHFVEEICAMNGLPPVAIAAEALDLLVRYPWPGNVRELRSAIERAVILAERGKIRPGDLPEAVRLGDPGGGPAGPASRFRDAKRLVVESFEREYLQELLARHGGNVTASAAQAGMLRSALQRLLRKYEIRSSEYRRGRSEKGPDA